MKKKTKLIISHCVVSIIFCLIGFLIGNNIDNFNKGVGIYHTYNWYNSSEANLILRQDSTCVIPDTNSFLEYDKCTWSISDTDIALTYTSERYDGETKDHTIHITLVDNGVLYGDVLFEKIG